MPRRVDGALGGPGRSPLRSHRSTPGRHPSPRRFRNGTTSQAPPFLSTGVMSRGPSDGQRSSGSPAPRSRRGETTPNILRPPQSPVDMEQEQGSTRTEYDTSETHNRPEGPPPCKSRSETSFSSPSVSGGVVRGEEEPGKDCDGRGVGGSTGTPVATSATSAISHRSSERGTWSATGVAHSPRTYPSGTSGRHTYSR